MGAVWARRGGQRVRYWQPVLGFLFFLVINVARADTGLEYRVVYSGVFSAGADLPIADLQLVSRKRAGVPGLVETRIDATSVGYPLVERLFPIRYRFRNWVVPGEPARLLGFETYESMRRQRHHLYLGDDSVPGHQRYDLLTGEGRGEIAKLESGVVPVALADNRHLLDRLGMLQRLRREHLHERAVLHFDVTNGRERLKYRVSVEAAQDLKLDDVAIPAWKLRVDGEELDRRGRWKPAHRPLHLWLSQAPGRIPLRVDARHGVGMFRIQLKNALAMDHLTDTGT